MKRSVSVMHFPLVRAARQGEGQVGATQGLQSLFILHLPPPAHQCRPLPSHAPPAGLTAAVRLACRLHFVGAHVDVAHSQAVVLHCGVAEHLRPRQLQKLACAAAGARAVSVAMLPSVPAHAEK